MKIRQLFGGLSISSAALSAQRKRMNAIAENIANAETTRTEQGTPYRRKIVNFTSTLQRTFAQVMRNESLELATTQRGHLSGGSTSVSGVPETFASVEAIEVEDTKPFRMVYDPDHPDADEQGYVKMPNVNVVAEMVEMIAASRAYEANATVITAAKNVAKDALEI
jgi:flagellar basal-body rod protein FlgC